MPNPDRINDMYPSFLHRFEIDMNETVEFDFNLINWGTDFFMTWAPMSRLSTMISGSITLTLQELTPEGGDFVPPDRIILTEAAKEVGMNPLVILPPGDIIDTPTGLARMFGIRSIRGAGIGMTVKALNVAPEQIILFQVISYPLRTPVDTVQVTA